MGYVSFQPVVLFLLHIYTNLNNHVVYERCITRQKGIYKITRQRNGLLGEKWIFNYVTSILYIQLYYLFIQLYYLKY